MPLWTESPRRKYRMTVQKIGMPAWAFWSQVAEFTDDEIEAMEYPGHTCVFEPMNDERNVNHV